MNKDNSDIAALHAEWSHYIEAENILSGKPLKLHLSPNEEERAALALRLDLIEVKKLEADIELSRVRGGLVVYVKGRFSADIVQRCVVSLEPVPAQIEDQFEAWFTDEGQAISLDKIKRERSNAHKHGEQPITEENEDPEAIIDGRIDLGDLVTQFLSLALDPFPRAEGHHYGIDDEEKNYSEKVTEVRKNPFAALKDWKVKDS